MASRGERDGRPRAPGARAPASGGPAPRSSSLWRDAVSPFPPGSAGAALPCSRSRPPAAAAAARPSAAATEPPPAASTPAGVQAAAFDPRDAPLGCLGVEGHQAEKDARQTDRLDVLPAEQRRLRRVRRDARGGAGPPDPQRGARRRGDRPAPAHRRAPRRRRAQSDRDLPAGAGLEVLRAPSACPPRTKRLLLLVVWVVPIAGVVWWATKQRRRRFPQRLRRDHGARRRARALRGRDADARRALGADPAPRRVKDATRADAYALVPVGYMGNNVLPARGGELLRTFLLGGARSATKRTILGTILAERVLDAVALGVILVVLACRPAAQLPHAERGRSCWSARRSSSLLALAAPRSRSCATASGWCSCCARSRRWRQPSRQLLSRFGRRAARRLAADLVRRGERLHRRRPRRRHHAQPAGRPRRRRLHERRRADPGGARLHRHVRCRRHLRRRRRQRRRRSPTILSYLLLLRFVLFVPITLVGLVLLVVRYGGLSRIRAARAAASGRDRGGGRLTRWRPRPQSSAPRPHWLATLRERLTPRATAARGGDRRPRLRAAGGARARARRAHAALPEHADVRPVGLDHLGPRDRPPRPADDRRPVVEAAPGPLHDGLLAVRRGGAGPVARRRARRRDPRA